MSWQAWKNNLGQIILEGESLSFIYMKEQQKYCPFCIYKGFEASERRPNREASVFCEVRFSRLDKEEIENLAGECFLRGLPNSRPNREEIEFAQAGQSKQDACDRKNPGLKKKIRTIFFGRRIPVF